MSIVGNKFRDSFGIQFSAVATNIFFSSGRFKKFLVSYDQILDMNQLIANFYWHALILYGKNG